MTFDRRDLAAHMVPEITEGRLARQWAALEQKRPTGPQRSQPVWLFSAAATLVVGALAWLWWSPTQLPGSGALIETADTPTTMQLRDGSSLELAAQTRLRVLRDQPSAVEVELAQGSANFDVTHVDGRAFSVRAGEVTVRVVGTKFDVVKVSRPEGQEIAVAVQRGIVAVERADHDARRLTAGEKWSVWVPAESDLPKPQITQEQAATAEPSEAVAERSAPKPTAAPSHHKPSSRMRTVIAPAQDQQDRPLEDVRGLFERATVARRAGLMQEAADVYAELLRRFPKDSRAATSAFELGRIRMDALDDPRGAAQAFSDALHLSRRAQFREDALARLAIANDALGDREGCRRVRELYLKDFPGGVHAGSLASLCNDTNH
ncbi:MAG: FecR domain-containing protein [Polyangiales bacterium]